MSTSRVIWRVAKREVKTRMLTKANIVSLSVIVLLIAVGAGVAHYFMDRDGEPPVSHVGVAAEVAELESYLDAVATSMDVRLETRTITAQEAESALADPPEGEEPLDAYLDGDPAAPRMLVADQPDEEVLQIVQGAVQSYVRTEQISELGGDPTAFEQRLATAAPQVEAVNQTEDDEFDGAAFGVAMAMISLLFGSLIGTGSLIAMGVVEEKTSRVVEILLATIRPSQLLTGKILGIGIYGLFQIVVLGGALALAALSLGLGGLDIDVGSALVSLLGWFLIGYVLFALLFGGFAALVSRQEDIGSVTTPLMFLLFIPFYATMFLVPNDPDSTIVRVLSMIPFFAPFMIPVRDAFGALEGWEMLLSVSISLVTIPALIWVAARVYQRGVLHTGGRMNLKEALRG